ncbi:MAG: hypothetical protein WBA68_06825 [Alteraurantiacibacter sp.]
MASPGRTKLRRFAIGIATGIVSAFTAGWLIHPDAGIAVTVLAHE